MSFFTEYENNNLNVPISNQQVKVSKRTSLLPKEVFNVTSPIFFYCLHFSICLWFLAKLIPGTIQVYNVHIAVVVVEFSVQSHFALLFLL